jgi:hypothetical protein
MKNVDRKIEKVDSTTKEAIRQAKMAYEEDHGKMTAREERERQKR